MEKNEKIKLKRAIFAAGCFWHVQHDFDMIKGVEKTTAGYIGGDEEKYPNPAYEAVHKGKTGHVEAVEILFNPEIITYKELLEKFWKMHNPFLKNRQGFDIGSQYQAGIFYTDESQKKEAEESKKEIEKQAEKKIFSGKVHTFIKKAGTFFPAEEYHQKYLEKKGLNSCPVN